MALGLHNSSINSETNINYKIISNHYD